MNTSIAFRRKHSGLNRQNAAPMSRRAFLRGSVLASGATANFPAITVVNWNVRGRYASGIEFTLKPGGDSTKFIGTDGSR